MKEINLDNQNTPCEICNKIKDNVRFEGSFEGYICDSCLEEIKREENEELSDAEILNDIENRIREDKPVLKREIDLLLECYCTYGVRIPKDIRLKIMKGGFI